MQWNWSRIFRSCIFLLWKFGPSFSSRVGRSLIYLVPSPSFPGPAFSVDPYIIKTDLASLWLLHGLTSEALFKLQITILLHNSWRYGTNALAILAFYPIRSRYEIRQTNGATLALIMCTIKTILSVVLIMQKDGLIQTLRICEIYTSEF